MLNLRLEKLVKIYNDRVVVNSVSLKVESSKVIGLLGPNGAGKTTTFYMAVGMIKPENGCVFLNQENITKMPMHLRARKGIGYLPQESSIFKKLTVEENITAVLEILPIKKSNHKAVGQKLLKELGIDHLSKQKASSLSGGERRRLEIARVLSTKPSFILLDEPFAGIDPLAIIDIQKIIRYLCTKKIGILISDHNVRETLGVCDTAYILNNGQVIESGTPEEITNSKIARKIYLGDKFKL